MTIRAGWLAAAPAATPEPSFCVGAVKLLVMSIATFGVYSVYWMFRNWRAEQARSGDHLSPIARSVFAVLFFHSFASRVADRAQAGGIAPQYSPALLTVLFIGLSLSARLPDPWWVLSLGAVTPLLPVQRALQAIDDANGIDARHYRLFGGGEIACFAIGATLWLLILTGLLLPDPS